MNIAILGPQGSGKGTQADLLSERKGFIHVETGKLLRKIAESNLPLSQEIRGIMIRGELVADHILEKVLNTALESSDEGKSIVFDGTPRNMVQYDLLKKILSERGLKIDKIFMINIPEEESVRRLSSRRTCGQCGDIYNLITNPSPRGKFCECGGELYQREDDQPEAISKRLENYRKETVPVLKSAQEDGILVEIDGLRPIEEIYKDIEKNLKI